jgi:hypothetical protein
LSGLYQAGIGEIGHRQPSHFCLRDWVLFAQFNYLCGRNQNYLAQFELREAVWLLSHVQQLIDEVGFVGQVSPLGFWCARQGSNLHQVTRNGLALSR